MISVNVNDLSSKFLSRERGHEAAEKLAADYIGYERICVNLDAAESISLSFLDGLILALDHKNMMGKVVFHTKNSDIYSKLSCITGARNITIYDASLSKIVPVRPKEETPNFVKDKALLFNV